MRIIYSNEQVVCFQRHGFSFSITSALYLLFFFFLIEKSSPTMADTVSNYVVVSCNENLNSVKIQPVFIYSGRSLPVGAISTNDISHFTDKSPATKVCALNKNTLISIKVGENPNSPRNDNVKIFINDNLVNGFFGFVPESEMKNKYFLIENKFGSKSYKIEDCLSSENCKSASIIQ